MERFAIACGSVKIVSAMRRSEGRSEGMAERMVTNTVLESGLALETWLIINLIFFGSVPSEPHSPCHKYTHLIHGWYYLYNLTQRGVMKVLGMISGTSHDGIDVAVVYVASHESALTGTLLHSQSTPYDDSLRQRLIDALPPAPTTFAEMCELDTLIGQEFAAAAQQTIAAVGEVDFICSHGQTVFHWVNNDSALGTLQTGQPAWIAAATNTPVVSDARIRDITLGGHGAPLVSILDQMLLNSLPGKPAALNMGGISNMTVLGAETPPLAYDVGPANALIDAVISQRGLHPAGYDHDGEIASAGTVNSELLNALLSEPYYDLPAPKSTGKELFHGQYVADALSRLESPIDDVGLVAMLTELTVQTVARDVKKHGVTHLVISGGGSHNPVIMDGLRAQL